MSFWNSPLIKNIEQGELPVVEVEANVRIDEESLLQIGAVLLISLVATMLLYKLIVKK